MDTSRRPATQTTSQLGLFTQLHMQITWPESESSQRNIPKRRSNALGSRQQQIEVRTDHSQGIFMRRGHEGNWDRSEAE